MKKTLQLFLMTFLTVTAVNAQTLVVDGVTYQVTGPGEVGIGDSNEIGQGDPVATYSGTDLETVVIPATIMDGAETYTVTSFVEWAFAGNTTMVSLDLSATGLTNMSRQALYNCSALTTVILPTTMTEISGLACIQNSSNLTSINVENVETLGNRDLFKGTGILSMDFASLVDINSSNKNRMKFSSSVVLLKIGSNWATTHSGAFNDLTDLQAIELGIETPIATAIDFTNTDKSLIDLYLPSAAAVTAFQNDATYGWGGFKSYSVGSAPSLEALLSTNEVESSEFSMYPNPTDGIVSIRNSKNEDMNVSVYDLNGRSLLSANDSQVDISDLASGVYLFRVKTESAEVVKRVIKN